MKLVRWIQESWRRRRPQRPTRRLRFADQFAAALVIKPLENRLVLNGAPILQEVGVALTAEGSLLITGTSEADSVTVQSDVANSQYIINDSSHSLSITGIEGASLSSDGHTAFVPFTSVSGNQIVESLGGGDDVFNIDFTLGAFSKSIVIDGSDGNDGLAITGFGSIATYTPGDITGSGVIAVGGDQISFSGLEPIDYNVSGGTFVLDLAGSTNDNVMVSESTLLTDASLAAIDVAGTVDGVAFEDVRVRGSSIVINTRGGDDTVTLNATGKPHNDVNLTVNTGGDSGDVINVSGTVSVSGTTTLDAQTINLNADISGAVTGSTATAVNVTEPGEVQDGLAVAASGGTVKLAAGNYDGAVSIVRAVSLTGSGDASAVILNGPISITASGTVVIDGLTVNNSITDPGADLTIQNSIITAIGNAIDISGVNSALIQNNVISAGGDAIHGQGVTGNVTILGNFITADRGVWLQDIDGLVQIGGLTPGKGNNILAFHEGIVLAGGIVGVVSIDGNLINAQSFGLDFEDGENDFTARGNDITVDAALGDGAGILVRHSSSGNITIGGTGPGEGNTITASGTAFGVWIDTVLSGDVSVLASSITAMTTAVKLQTLSGGLTISGNSNLSSDTAEDVLARDVAGNVMIQGNSFGGFGSFGLDLQNMGTDSASSVLIGGSGPGDGNTLFGPQTGFSLVNVRNLTVQNNSLVQTTLGIYISLTPGLTAATLSGNTINTASTGEGVVLDGRTGATRVDFGSGNTITGGTVGLLIEGAGVLLPSLSLNDLVLESQTGNYIALRDGALAGQEIDGTGVTYGTLLGSAVSVAQGYQITDRVLDAIDDASLGFVRVRSGQIYVTENSFNAPTTTVANIQRAVDVAASGDTIHIQAGSYTGDIDTTAPGKSVTLSPGDGPGQVVNNGSLTLDVGDTLAIQVDTTVAVTGYDSFVIVGGGTVTLNNATLALSGNLTAAPNDVVLIDNDGVEAVVGIFNGLPEQSLVNINGVNFRLTYQGGADGNDVVLRSGANADTFVTLVSDGLGGFNLLIYDFNAASDDQLTIEADVANSRYIISDPNLIITTDIPSAGGDISHTIFVPFAVVTGGSINVNTLEGNDSLTIDYFRGNFSKAVHFDAGDGTDDSLTLANTNAVVTTYAAVQHTFTSTSSGAVAITNNALVTYSNLEPIFDNLIATSREFTFAGNNNDHIVFADAGTTTDSLESISSEFSDLVTFRDPTASLTINAGDGDDVIRINQLDTNYQAALTVLGQDGIDEIKQLADLTLATTQASGDLFYQAEKITLSGDLHTPGTATYDTGFTAGSIGVTESSGATINSNKLRFIGSGTFAIEQANDVATLAANIVGPLSYVDVNVLTIGNVDTTTGITTTASDVKLTTGGDLSLEAAISLGAGDLTLNTTGNVSQLAVGAITATGLQILGSGTVRLDTAANNVATLAANHTGTISYTDTSGLTIGTVTDTAAAVSVSTTGITTGSDVKLTTGGDLALDAAISLGAGDLTLNTSGNVSQLAAGAITANGLQILGNGTVHLDTAANNVATLAANHTGTISYTDTSGLIIGTVTDTAAAVSVATIGITTTGSDVKLTTGGDSSLEAAISLGAGDLTLNTTGNVSQLAVGAIKANGLQILGNGTVRLDTAANNVATLAANHTDTISYTDTGGLTIGTVTDTAAAVSVSTTGITTTGSDVKLTTGGDLALEAAISLSAGNLTLTTTGNVSQLAIGSITANGLQILGNGTVRLDNTANNVATLAANHTGTISYTDTNSLTIGTVTDTAAAVSVSTTGITTTTSDVKLTTGGDLSLEAAISLGAGDLTLNTTGNVSQLATGSITANGLQILGNGTVRLDNAANNVATLAANHTGTISYTDTSGLTIGTVTDTAAAVSVSTTGITTTGSDVKLTTGGDLSLEAAISLGAGDLTLNTTGNVSQLATGSIAANGLQILGNGTVRLDTAANNMTVLAANHTGTISYTDTNGLIIGTVTDTAAAVGVSTTGITTTTSDVKLTTGGDLSIEAAISLGAGDLTLNTTGNVSQSAAGSITANGLQILGNGTVHFDVAINDIDVLAANHTGTISYTDTNSLTIGTVTDTAALVSATSSGIKTNSGDIAIHSGGLLTVNQTIDTNPGVGGLITVSNAILNAALIAGSGNITLNGGGSDLIINFDQASSTTLTYSADHDIIIRATVSANGPASDLLLRADSDNDGVGGFWLDEAPPGTDAKLIAGQDITIQGSDLFLTPAADSILIDSDAAAVQILAGRDIALTGNTISGPGTTPTTNADIFINGLQVATEGSIFIDAAHVISLSADQHAGTDITLKDATQLSSSVNLIAGRDMTFAGRIDDDGNIATSSSLTITAARDVAFFGNVGESQALSSLTITGAVGVIFGDADNSAPNAAAINTIRTSGDINIGSLAPIGNRGIIFDGGTAANSSVTMTTSGGGNVRLNGAVRLDSNLRINTAGTSDGTILFTNDSPIDSQTGEFNDLSLNAGTGSVLFNEDVGAAQRLGSLTIEAASRVTFGEADVETAAAGTTGPVNTINTNGAIDIGSQSVIVGGIVFNGGNTTLTVTTNNANLRLNGAVTLNSNLKIDTGTGAGDILFTAASAGSGRIDSQSGEHNDLTLNAGTGSIFFNGNIGANQSLGSLVVDTAAGGVTFGGADTAITSGSGPLTIIRTEGIIDIGSGTDAADVIGGNGIIFNGGSLQLAVTTNNANVRLNGAVTLHSSLKISTGSGTGDVIFTNDTPIDSQAGEFNALTIDAGIGIVRFNEDLGKAQRLGGLTIEKSSRVIFGEADSEGSSGATGPVSEINTNGQIDIGSASVISGGILLNGGTSNLLAITTLGDSVRLNGTVTLASNLRIDTDSTTSGTEGGDISFTAASPIDSVSGELNDLTLAAGTGNITFAATVGSSTLLKVLTIEQARDVTFQSTLRTSGSLIQISGTGTTTFHGVSGGGIGGQLDITTVNVVLAASEIVTVGTAKIIAAQSLSFGDLAGLNAGSSSITLGAGSGGLTQATTAIIQTSNNTENALQIAIGNGGNAHISDLRVGIIGGTIHLTAAGGILDNSTGEGASLTATAAILEAGTGIGASGAADIDTDVSLLSAKTARNDIYIQERDAVQLGRAANENLSAADGSIFIDAGGSITIVQSAVAGSSNNQGPTARAASITLQTGGFVQIDSAVTANHGSIIITATSTIGNVHINGAVKTFGGSISVDSGGIVQIDQEATATNGSITLKTENSNGNVLINGNLKAPQGTITVTAGGLIQIQDGIFLQSAASDYVKQSPGEIVTGGPSAAGQVSNAPPRLQVTQINPNDVILPADRTQEVRGAIGVGGNLEQGANLTLTVTWADGKTTVLTGLQAGDSVTWRIDENGNTTGVQIQHGSQTGQITIDRIERTYSLTFLAGLMDNKVTAGFQLANDRFIQLVDSSSRDLNRSDVTAITTTVSNKDIARPPIVLLEQPRVVVAEVRAAVHTEVVQNLIVVLNRYQDLNLGRTEGQTEGPVLFLVAVGPDGEEGARVLLPVSELKNLAGLLERLKKAQIPSAMYRLYYQEPGLPPQQVLEFRKTGNMIGDPVREPGRGTNPVEHQPPAQQPVAPDRAPNQIMHQPAQSTEPAMISIESAIAQAADQSFTRAARLLRGRPR